MRFIKLNSYKTTRDELPFVDADAGLVVPVIGSNLFVTAVAIAGAKLPADRVLDGGNFLPAITYQAVERARPLYWRCAIAPSQLKLALRIGDWKILADESLQQFELYDLKSDPQEKADLSASQRAKFAELKTALLKLKTEIEAKGPDWWKKKESGEKDASDKKAGKNYKKKPE